jgi:hypothetical protein
MTNYEFKDLWERFQDTGKKIDSLLQDEAFVAASSHAHGADETTVGIQFLESLAAIMESEVADFEDETRDMPSQAEMNEEIRNDR